MSSASPHRARVQGSCLGVSPEVLQGKGSVKVEIQETSRGMFWRWASRNLGDIQIWDSVWVSRGGSIRNAVM